MPNNCWGVFLKRQTKKYKKFFFMLIAIPSLTKVNIKIINFQNRLFITTSPGNSCIHYVNKYWMYIYISGLFTVLFATINLRQKTPASLTCFNIQLHLVKQTRNEFLHVGCRHAKTCWCFCLTGFEWSQTHFVTYFHYY